MKCVAPQHVSDYVYLHHTHTEPAVTTLPLRARLVVIVVVGAKERPAGSRGVGRLQTPAPPQVPQTQEKEEETTTLLGL